MESNLQDLNKAAVTNGLVIGVIMAVVGILTFYVAPNLMGSTMFGIGLMLLSLAFYIYFTIDLRKKIGGYWNFKSALKGIFLMAFVAGLVGMVFNFIFYKFIEPDGFEKISGYITEGTTKTFENLGMEQDKIDEAVEKQLEAMKAQFDPTFKDLARNFGIAVLVQFIMSLIFAAIFKKESPAFAPTTED
ncbi:DUF4199 domain-containing protein [Flavihumibacter sp. R14]|nr:DUF4199 domain-containing protein [Flavihumibacter soli]